MRLKLFVGLIVIGAALAWIASQKLPGSVVYFVTPSELLAGGSDVVGKPLRLGGQVVSGSARRSGESVLMVVTDGNSRVSVVHDGDTPELFRSGIGVVLEGTFGKDAVFRSETMLIKHSENYRPPKAGEDPAKAQLAS